MKLKLQINQVIKEAFSKAGIEHEPMSVSEATKAEFGDFQFNGAMALSKKLGKNPRAIATDIIENLDLSGVISKAEIAGPGDQPLYRHRRQRLLFPATPGLQDRSGWSPAAQVCARGLGKGGDAARR